MFSFLSTVAPDKVTIKGPTEAKVGDSLRFECATSNSNPPASVQWVVDGRAVHENFTHSVSIILGGGDKHGSFAELRGTLVRACLYNYMVEVGSNIRI